MEQNDSINTRWSTTNHPPSSFKHSSTLHSNRNRNPPTITHSDPKPHTNSHTQRDTLTHRQRLTQRDSERHRIRGTETHRQSSGTQTNRGTHTQHIDNKIITQHPAPRTDDRRKCENENGERNGRSTCFCVHHVTFRMNRHSNQAGCSIYFWREIFEVSQSPLSFPKNN